MCTETRPIKHIGLQFFADAPEGAATNAQAPNAAAEGSTPPAAENPASPANTAQYTQEQVNSMMANEKRTARNALLKELGYEVKDGDYKTTVKGIKAALDAGKTQAQLDADAKAQAESDKAAAEARASAAEAKVVALSAGVKPDCLDDVIALALPKVTETDTLEKVIAAMKTKYPVFFAGEVGSSGTGSSANPPRNKGGQAEGLGKRLAQTTKHDTKSSYFKN